MVMLCKRRHRLQISLLASEFALWCQALAQGKVAVLEVLCGVSILHKMH